MWRIEGMIWMRKIRMKTSSCEPFFRDLHDLERQRAAVRAVRGLHCVPNGERARMNGVRGDTSRRRGGACWRDVGWTLSLRQVP